MRHEDNKDYSQLPAEMGYLRKIAGISRRKRKKNEDIGRFWQHGNYYTKDPEAETEMVWSSVANGCQQICLPL